MNVAIRRRPDGTWQACTHRADGRMVCVSVRELDMAQEIARRVAHRMPAGASAGGLWSGIKKIAHKVAKARVVQKLGEAVKAIDKNPMLRKAVGLGVMAVTGIPPQATEALLHVAATGKLDASTLTVAMGIPGGAEALAAQSAAQDPTVRAQLVQAIAAAKAGDPQAKQVVARAAAYSRTARGARLAHRVLVARAKAGDPRACAMLVQARARVAQFQAARPRFVCPPGGASAGGPFALPRSDHGFDVGWATADGYRARSRVSFAPVRRLGY